MQRFNQGSLHDFIRQEIGYPLSRHQTRVSARRADAQVSKLLTLSLQSPLLCIRTLNTLSGSNIMAEYSVSLTRADMIELTLEH
ncbi:UTRA domain-containing protein [Sodalis glossinidius]|uniref:UTRA domain-containing protein n=1 Tax=Sodalis glossinidius TaxID=63612 RepID=UPI0024354A9E|nr:UTRA domain-containing protein [Sodalis glossinidius]